MVPLRVLGAGVDRSFGIEKPPGFFQDVGHPCFGPSDVDQLSFCCFNLLKQGQQLFVVRTLGAEHTHASFLHGLNSVPRRSLLGSGVLGSLFPVRGWGGRCGRALDGLCVALPVVLLWVVSCGRSPRGRGSSWGWLVVVFCCGS